MHEDEGLRAWRVGGSRSSVVTCADTAGCAVTPIRPIGRVGHHLPKVTVGTWCGLASELGFPL